MNPKLIASLVFALSMTTAAAHGRTQPWKCEPKVGGTNADWDECMGREVKSQDARLNRAWKVLLPLLEPRSRADMIAEERAWVAYKEKSCAMYANGDFGREGQVLHWGACRSAVIGRRADEIEDTIDFVKPR